MKKSHLLMLGCLLVVAACVGAERRTWTKSFLSKKAPELVVEKWLTKEPDRKGKFVLIDFWSTSDSLRQTVSRKTIPRLNALHRKYGDRLVVIGLSDETEEKVRSLKEPAIEYFSAIDPQQRTATALGVDGLPNVVIIDPQGIVRWQGFHVLDGTEVTEKAATKLLEKHDGL